MKVTQTINFSIFSLCLFYILWISGEQGQTVKRISVESWNLFDKGVGTTTN